MGLKQDFKLWLSTFVLAALVGCNDNDSSIQYTDGLAVVDEISSSTILINSNTSVAITLNSKMGLNQTDRLLMRSVADPSVEVPVKWGYKYLGKGHDPLYDFSSVIIQLGFEDRWTTGNWELTLERGSERQVLKIIDCQILKLKKEEGNPNAHLNLDKLPAGLFFIYAEGWIGNAQKDTIEFVNEKTGIAYAASEVSVEFENNVQQMKVILKKDLMDKMETGRYILNAKRWEYSFRQKLGEFDYFLFKFVDLNPISKDEKGQYFIDITLDEIVEGDILNISYDRGKKKFTVKPTAEFFNAEAKTYHIVIPERYIKTTDFGVSLARKGTINEKIPYTGSKSLTIE
ncbi:MAG: hypothetical protein RR319_06405 [Bacteroides sp.]